MSTMAAAKSVVDRFLAPTEMSVHKGLFLAVKHLKKVRPLPFISRGYNSTYRVHNPTYIFIRPFTRVLIPFHTSMGPACKTLQTCYISMKSRVFDGKMGMLNRRFCKRCRLKIWSLNRRRCLRGFRIPKPQFFNLYACWGLNSHCSGDGHQPYSRCLYTH